jgi:hypothetical protein
MVKQMTESRIENSKTFSVGEDIVSRKNQDGTVVLMKMDDSEIFYKIDGVAASVWKLLEAQKNIGTIKSELLEEFNVTEDQLSADIESFVGDLINKNILK